MIAEGDFPTSTIDPTEPQPRWYVAHTHPHSEVKAAAHLRRQGYDVYVPRCRKSRRHARHVESISAPLFPRYLFIAIDINTQRWRSISSTTGVSYLISTDDKPAAVPTGIVEALKEREVDGHLTPDLRATFATSAELLGGLDERDRIELLFAMLDRNVDRDLTAA
jgi:transcriptional antiterminator RfaH